MTSPSCTVYENVLGGTRPRRHIAPQIRPAGLVVGRDCGTVAELTSNYYKARRETPDLIKSYRRGGEVGRTWRHYGIARDPPVDENIRHGIKGVVGEGARGCLQPPHDRMTALMEEQLECMYLSNIRKPLGHAPAPTYEITVPRDGFGVHSDHSESVKRVVYGGKDVDVLHPVGERKDRGYDWEKTGIDPTQFCFGKTVGASAMNTTANVTAADVMRESQPVSTVLPKLVKDYQSTSKSEIGKPRRYGFHNAQFEETAEQRAVQRSRLGDGDAAREVLSSWAIHPATLKAYEERIARETADALETMKELTATTVDDDSNKTRSRYECSFDGKRRGKAVALTELDDDVRAPHLLYPCHYVQLGVKSKYFAGGRTLEDIRSLCKKIDFHISDEQIEEVFRSIALDDRCGIEQFKNKAIDMGYLV
ncbi:flagella associated protein [Trypanosoma theileri]|uniref:Flagella associated protein n=1 Tax=Trypanosoma theileri TaxID=67003 RepID=A0A1X0P414_9TRYP|nr:flagella associated protein [Trypanosoma theileri]ORC91403.1 flagella associated protein [Trypanosoma theileri]